MKLHQYIQLHLDRKFEWGRNDCCTFIGGWLLIQTGNDYLAEHRPWSSAREAAEKLRDAGGILSFFQKNLKPIHANFAQDGDVTIHQGTACIFNGRHIVSVGENGLVTTDRMVVTEAWTCRPY